jgi:hypothetical protein
MPNIPLSVPFTVIYYHTKTKTKTKLGEYLNVIGESGAGRPGGWLARLVFETLRMTFQGLNNSEL